VRRSANQWNYPDNVYGYGIPDFWKAYQMGKEQ
jgi:serine protease AprX